MLFPDFYTVHEINQIDDKNFEISVSINPKNRIFEGHFPNHPVTPGVTMVQMVKELTENILNKPLRLTNASSVKFVALIDPKKNPDLKVNIEISTNEDEIKVKNVTSIENSPAVKFIGIFKAA